MSLDEEMLIGDIQVLYKRMRILEAKVAELERVTLERFRTKLEPRRLPPLRLRWLYFKVCNFLRGA